MQRHIGFDGPPPVHLHWRRLPSKVHFLVCNFIVSSMQFRKRAPARMTSSLARPTPLAAIARLLLLQRGASSTLASTIHLEATACSTYMSLFSVSCVREWIPRGAWAGSTPFVHRGANIGSIRGIKFHIMLFALSLPLGSCTALSPRAVVLMSWSNPVRGAQLLTRLFRRGFMAVSPNKTTTPSLGSVSWE